jgi:hypothetical protein
VHSHIRRELLCASQSLEASNASLRAQLTELPDLQAQLLAGQQSLLALQGEMEERVLQARAAATEECMRQVSSQNAETTAESAAVIAQLSSDKTALAAQVAQVWMSCVQVPAGVP